MQHDRTKRVGLELRRKKLFRFEHFATRGNVHQNLHLIAKKWISRSCADQQIIHLSGRQVPTHRQLELQSSLEVGNFSTGFCLIVAPQLGN